MKLYIAPVRPNTPHHLFSAFTETLETIRVSNTLVRAGFAYATLGGVQRFLSDGESVSQWGQIKKSFLIGLHHAITEPSALETLRSIPNTQVRVFIPGGRLRLEAFYARTVFHPKILAVSSVDGDNIRLLQAGSANLTASAIGHQPQNYEFSIAIQAETPGSLDRERLFDGWWSHLWRQSRPVDRDLIQRYAALRKRVLDHNPILRFATEAPPSIREAEHFFAEVGAGSGPPGWRHQIEFPESLVRFFGAVQRRRRDVTLKRREITWSGRPLSYKRTTFGVEIWRLGMPTQHTGGDPIAGRAIQFTRTPEDGAFEFVVVDVDAPEFREWVRLANLSGHLGATIGQGSRQYGFY
jgi:hypothetical protein